MLENKFVKRHAKAVKLVRSLKHSGALTSDEKRKLRKTVGDALKDLITHFGAVDSEEDIEIDESKPSVLLTSFVGSKGLSAGHVFIIGAHNGSMPKNSGNVKDVEISQFLVALTRTRKQCHIISNQWFISPKDRHGNWAPRFEKSTFISWIPVKFVEDRGVIGAGDLKVNCC